MGKKKEEDKGIYDDRSSYIDLWRVGEPWTERKPDTGGAVAVATQYKTAVDRLRSMARGWRPYDKKYEDFERKATIIGGVQALQAAGIAPWSTVDLSAVPPIKAVGDETEKPLLAAIGKVSTAHTLTRAANLVRQEVIKHKLEKAAWPARAMLLASAAYIAQDKRKKVEGGVSGGLGVAAVTATATVIGAPIGAILGAMSAVPAAMSARTSVEQARSEADVNRFQGEFFREIEDYTVAREAKQLALMEARQKRLNEQLELQNTYDAATQAKSIVNLINGTTWGLFLGGTSLALVYVYRRFNR